MDADADLRHRKEREFHDRVYASGEYHDRPAAKFYSIARAAYRFYEQQLLEDVAGKKVLEYGCGDGSYGFLLAHSGARVTGIDISSVAIGHAKDRARDEGVADSTEFMVMDCEALEFPDRTFDLICGGGILHHIDLSKGYPELSRTLKQDGRAVFLEPMGHNPLINWYRNRTPDLRTEDEHPLLESDLEAAGKHFERVERHYFHLLSLLAVPLRNRRRFAAVNRVLDRGDRALFTRLHGIRKHAWMIALVMSQPH